MANNVNTISFGPGTSNADLQAQQNELLRRQKVAAMLRDQSMQQEATQMVSGRAIPTSKWSTLAKLFQAGTAAYMDKQDQGKQEQLGEIAAQRNAAALQAMAPPGVFDNQQAPGAGQAPPDGAGAPPAATMTPSGPIDLGAQPQASTPGSIPPLADTPPPARPQIDPETRQRWVQALATYKINPEVGGKLIQELSKPADFATKPEYDQNGNAFVLDNRGNKKMLDGVKARDKRENVNGVWVDPYAVKDGAVGPQDPNQPFMIGPDGKVAPNPAYQAYAMAKAKAGAASISTKTEVKMGESLAAQVGPILKESLSAAQGAQGQVDAANRIVTAVDTNKLFTGPMASKRLALAQYAQAFGIGGSDDAEKISNTRQAIRGFAEMTLQGRKQMSGQGAITDRESSLAEKATSGDIDNLTPAEIRIIAAASKRVAEHTIQNHQRLVQRTRADKNTAGLADYYDLTPMGGSSVEDLLKKYGGQ